jgi:TRAP-type C4-dicarboxylate transport system substrate-binding protein
MSTLTRRTALVAGATALTAAGIAAPRVARAQSFPLRIQTHHTAESVAGRVFLQFVEDCRAASDGRLQIEAFTSAAVVKSVETFDAASTGILDGDMTGAAYLSGKDPAFQAFGDLLGGYTTPDQMVAWLEVGGGREIADPLYNRFGMHMVGFWGDLTESLVASKPIRTMADLKDWKFRCPPGMQTEIFAKAGASPIVMDFGEVFTALQTGVVDGADAGTLNINRSLGLYEIATFTTFPGFHSMPVDHLAMNKAKWDELPDDLKRVMEIALARCQLRRMMLTRVADAEAARELSAQGVELIDWSEQDRREYREFAQTVWEEWGTRSPAAEQAFGSNIEFMKRIGVLG